MDDCAGASGLLPLTCTSSRPRPDVCVVRPVGELDIATAPLLAEYLREHSADRPAELVLDLSAVTLLAATGVGMIVRAAHNHDGVHGRLHLTGVTGNRPVQRVLDLTGVAALVDVRPSVVALLEELGDG
jgi:anti-anti-sigma factor